MAKFQVGDKVSDRYTGAVGVVTDVDMMDHATVEWLDDTRRLQVAKFGCDRLVIVETAAAAGEGEQLEPRKPVDWPDDVRVEDDPPRELRVTEPAPADGGEAAALERESTVSVVDPVTLEATGEDIEAVLENRHPAQRAAAQRLLEEDDEP